MAFTDAGDYTLSSPQHLWTFQTSGGKNAQYDVKPTERAYRVEVGGSNTSKTLTITKK